MVNAERVSRIMQKSAGSEASRPPARTEAAARPRLAVPPPPPPARPSSVPPPLPDMFDDSSRSLVDRQSFPPIPFEPRESASVLRTRRAAFELSSASPELPPIDPVASVRVGRGGVVLASEGSADLLPQLVAYVSSVVALLSRDLALDPFCALCAELVGLRLIVFRDGGEFVGLLFESNAQLQRVRQRLGV